MKKISIIIIVVTMFVGCKSNKQEEYTSYSGGEVPLITVNSPQPKVLDWDNAIEVNFDDIIEDIRYIPLGDEEDVMGQIKQILYHDGI